MSKELKFSKRATKDLKGLIYFYKELYGVETTERIINTLYDDLEILYFTNQFPKIGMKDEVFSNLKFEYRKIFHGKIKITYRVTNGAVFIFRVFDSRQNPKKNL